jgi:hypothetical protein
MSSRIIYVLFSVLVSVVSTSGSIAQSVDVHTITWTASERIDLLTGTTYTKRMAFTTHGDQRINIPNRMLSDVQATKVEGVWNDLGEKRKFIID